MTVVQYVSQKEMEKQTGFKKPLGYSLPSKNKILIRKGLNKSDERKVKQHEEQHMFKGEEGPAWWVPVIQAVGAIAGGLLSSKGAKSAAATAAGGSERELRFLEESRDLARSDQAPYREAGYTALDALMSMTGLKQPTPQGGGGRGESGRRGRAIGGAPVASTYLSGLGSGGGGGRRVHMRNYGGNLYGRAHGGNLYNINELGPESVYENGSYTRSNMPTTVPESNGYVAPNIHGRAYGGYTRGPTIHQGPVGWGGPQRIPDGTPSGGTPPATIDNNTGTIDNKPGPYVPPQENPGGVAGGYSFMTDPGYEFRLGEGQRVLERGATAAGGLLSGGYGRRLTRYAQDYAANEYTNVYNRISNIAGLGQVSAGQSGNAALMAGQGMGTAATQGAYATAYGQQASNNAWANAANQISQLPWGDMFNRNTGGGNALSQGRM